MWKLTEWAKTRAGVTGVPWRDLSDEEFEGVAAQFEQGALLPYFEHVAEDAPAWWASAEPEPGPEPEPEQPPTPGRYRGATRRSDR